MSKLHEILAAESTVAATWNTLYDETLKKFGNAHFFSGHTKSLKMLEDTPANAVVEAAARDHKDLPTTVAATLDYALATYARAEDLQAQKNTTNTVALADVVFRGKTLFTALPVDELLGLESRLGKIRALYAAIPTLDASKRWNFDPTQNCWVSDEEATTKTEKIMFPVVMAAATDKHPAQIKESTRDNVVGKFTLVQRSGAATAAQKADALQLIDELLVEVKKARMRANSVEVKQVSVGTTLREVLLSPFQPKG